MGDVCRKSVEPVYQVQIGEILFVLVYVVAFDNATSNHGNLVVRGYHVILRGGSSLQVFFFVDLRLNYVICAHLRQPSSIKVKHIVQLISGFYIQASYSVLTFSVVLHC